MKIPDSEEKQTDKAKAIANNPDAESNVRNGQVIIFILAGFVLIYTSVLYSISLQVEVIYANAPIVFIYMALGVFYYRNPYIIYIIALCIYLALQLVNTLVDPSSIKSGLIIKCIIIFGLARCIKFARYYKIQEIPKENNLLDNDLM